MKEKLILTDADGVLCRWNTGFNKFMASNGILELPDTDTEYSIAIRYGITPQHAFALIKEFNEGPYIAELEPFADSVNYISRLADKGFRFIVVTSLSDSPHAKYHRSKNLQNIFGNVFDEINCLEMGINKTNELSRWKDSGYFWIEDHTQQAEAGHSVGLKPVLINHPHNAFYKTELFPSVSFEKPWEEIYRMIEIEYNL